MINNERLSPENSASPPVDANYELEQAYQQKINARKCLNMLVDIKIALSRQNKMLESMIDRFNAAERGKTSR